MVPVLGATPSSLVPPLAQYGILTGQLFLYASGRAAFESVPEGEGDGATTKKVIFVGGLSDGLLPCPYTAQLEAVCHQQQWSLVQPILSSAYLGFGVGSLARDVTELEELLDYLTTYRHGTEFALIGHSTGCQDAVCFLQHQAEKASQSNSNNNNNHHDYRDNLRFVGLQAPVSDRESAALSETEEEGGETLATKLAYCTQLLHQQQGQELLPRSYHWAPITAQRYVDLHQKDGKDDYFSSDYTDTELKARLQHCSSFTHHQKQNQNQRRTKILVAFSGADQYVPEHIDKRKLTQRLVNAMNGHCPPPSGARSRSEDADADADEEEADGFGRVAEGLYIEQGNHNLSDPNDAKLFVEKVAEFLAD